MKKTHLFYPIFLLSILSCSSDKVISEYLKNDINSNKKTIKEIILIKEKKSRAIAIKTLKGDGIKNSDGNVIYSGSKLINQKDFLYVENYNIGRLEDFWSNKNFNDLTIKIFDNKDDSLNNYLKQEKASNNGVILVYSISNIIYLKNKKYAFFYIDKGSTEYSKLSIYAKSVLLKKKNGKWKIIEEIESTDIN